MRAKLARLAVDTDRHLGNGTDDPALPHDVQLATQLTNSPLKTVVDFGGIEGRAEPLPLPRGHYRSLRVGRGSLFFLDADEGDFNRFDIREPGTRKLMAFDLEERKTRRG